MTLVVLVTLKVLLLLLLFLFHHHHYYYYYHNDGFPALPASLQPARQHLPVPHGCTTESCDVTRGRGQRQQRDADTDGHSGHVGRRHPKPQRAGKRGGERAVGRWWPLDFFAYFQTTFASRVRRFPPC